MRDFSQNFCGKRIFFRYLQSQTGRKFPAGRISSAVEHFTRNEGVPSSNLGFSSRRREREGTDYVVHCKKSYVSTTCKTFSFSGVRREQLRAGVRLPAGAAVPSPETTGNEPRAAGPSAGRRHKIRPAHLLFHLFSIPLLRNGSPNEAPGPGRLKGNAVKIGNSSLCCKFLPPKRHIRPRQSLATGFHATGKASGPERVRRPAAAMVLQSRGKWIVIGRKNDFRHIPECKIRLLRNSGRTHAVRPARMRISGTSAKIG